LRRGFDSGRDSDGEVQLAPASAAPPSGRPRGCTRLSIRVNAYQNATGPCINKRPRRASKHWGKPRRHDRRQRAVNNRSFVDTKSSVTGVLNSVRLQ